MLAQQSSQHQIQDQAEETVVSAENKVDSLIEHRQLLTRHLITTLIALNEVNKELENLLLLKIGRDLKEIPCTLLYSVMQFESTMNRDERESMSLSKV